MYFWVIICVIFILSVAGFAMVEVSKLRRRRLEKNLKLEITNLGNVECRFQLRAEEVTGGLSFQFLQNGAKLSEWNEGSAAAAPTNQPASPSVPRQGTPAARQQPSSISQKAQGAMNTGSIFSSLLRSVGSLLPGSAGSQAMRTGTKIAQTESKAVRVQQVAGQASSIKTQVQPASNRAAQATQTQLETSKPRISWSETAVIEPGKRTIIDLKVQSKWIKQNEARHFRIKSRSSDKEQSPLVVADGFVQIQGGFWSHHLYPMLAISGISILALGLVAWLASIGVLM